VDELATIDLFKKHNSMNIGSTTTISTIATNQMNVNVESHFDPNHVETNDDFAFLVGLVIVPSSIEIPTIGQGQSTSVQCFTSLFHIETLNSISRLLQGRLGSMEYAQVTTKTVSNASTSSRPSQPPCHHIVDQYTAQCCRGRGSHL